MCIRDLYHFLIGCTVCISVGKKDKKGPPPKPQKPLSPKKEEIVEKKDAAGKIQEGRGSVQEGDANKEGVIPIVKEAVIGTVYVLKFGTLVACQKGLDKQCRPLKKHSDQGLPCLRFKQCRPRSTCF